MSETSVEIGDSLRATREQLGWSLQDVAHRTRIPVAILRQLEANDFEHFPSRAYAKSFLAQYSEYLGVDSTEWLDSFDPGDVLADLDRYDYLKDHDEHVEASPLAFKPQVPGKRKSRQSRLPRSSRPGSLQPLLVFGVTAFLLTVAVFCLMKLSDQFAEDPSETVQENKVEETLAPLTGIREGRPDPLDLSRAPSAIPAGAGSLVAGDPNSALAPDTLRPSPEEVADELSLDSPPPRAVIVEE